MQWIVCNMPGIKRKEAPRTYDKLKSKKSRIIAPGRKQPKPARKPDQNAEAETDSDPIIESDTTDHSGDDDGTSWPSGDEEEIDDDGKVAAHVSSRLVPNGNSTNGTNGCT